MSGLWCTAESTAWPTTWTILILPLRKRSPRSCARLARCPGAPTSWAAPPRRWMTPRPSSSRLRPAPARSSSCTTSRCSNASCSDARRRRFVEIPCRPIRLRARPAIATAAAARRAGAHHHGWASRQAWWISGRSRPRSGTVIPLARAQARISAVTVPVSGCRPWRLGGSLGGEADPVQGSAPRSRPRCARRRGSGRSTPRPACGSRRTRSGSSASGPAARPGRRRRRRPDPVEGEDLRVAVLDHDRGAGQGGQLAQGEPQPAAGQAGDQVGQRLALHRGDRLAVDGDRVVPARQAAAHGADLLAGERVGVALVGVDHDLRLDDACGLWGSRMRRMPLTRSY